MRDHVTPNDRSKDELSEYPTTDGPPDPETALVCQFGTVADRIELESIV